MTRAAILFSVASLAPVPLILLGGAFGGFWAFLAAFYLSLGTFIIDQMGPRDAADGSPGEDFHGADVLSVTQGIGHFIVLGWSIYVLSGHTGLGIWSWGAIFLASAAFFGQVSNANAHELIHRRKRSLYRLGKAVYTSMLFGHQTSAHLLIHHRFVATADDPSSARAGQNFYHFAVHAWAGSFRKGYTAEWKRLKRICAGPLCHPYLEYVEGAVGFGLVAWLIGGWAGVFVWIGLAVYSTAHLLMADYVQHYGLRRERMPNGKLEPVADRHSWNAPHWFSRHAQMNAPRHSDHHAHPSRPYPELKLPPASEAPMLPYSLSVMGFLALFPPVWHKLMDPRLTRWQNRWHARHS